MDLARIMLQNGRITHFPFSFCLLLYFVGWACEALGHATLLSTILIRGPYEGCRLLELLHQVPTFRQAASGEQGKKKRMHMKATHRFVKWCFTVAQSSGLLSLLSDYEAKQHIALSSGVLRLHNHQACYPCCLIMKPTILIAACVWSRLHWAFATCFLTETSGPMEQLAHQWLHSSPQCISIWISLIYIYRKHVGTG
jgi:hypothetical protein